MTDVTHTPPALRWVALFLAACAVLGLFLGFRDQIRKNPPGWYTGAEQTASPLPATADGAREAVAFDPNAPGAAAGDVAVTATPTLKVVAPVDGADTAEPTEAPAIKAPTKPKPATPAAKTSPTPDPVGDILESQKEPEAPPPPAVPY